MVQLTDNLVLDLVVCGSCGKRGGLSVVYPKDNANEFRLLHCYDDREEALIETSARENYSEHLRALNDPETWGE